MKLLKEISDIDIGGISDDTAMYCVRKATRVILKRGDGKVAILNCGKDSYHKLIGGGIDLGENIIEGLRREVQEEAGCICDKIEEIGCVIEYRKEHNLIQINYCFSAVTTDTIFIPQFTQKELDSEFSLDRVEESKLRSIFEKDNTDNYVGKFVKIRILTLLEEYLAK